MNEVLTRLLREMPPDLPEVPDRFDRVRRRARGRRRIVIIASGVSLALGCAGAAVAVATVSGQPDRDRVASSSDTAYSRTFVRDGATWTLSRTSSAAGPCVGVTVSRAQGDGGSIGGQCGTSDSAGNRWGLGVIRVGGTSYNVAYGYVIGAVDVTATLGSGATIEDSGAGNGLWLILHPGDPNSPDNEITEFTARDSNGDVIAHVRLPSIVTARHHAAGEFPGSSG